MKRGRLRSDRFFYAMSEHHPNTDNPCVRCGACCASFRVSFYWAEAPVRGLSERWTEQVNPWHSCMAGTNQSAPRCNALHGVVGQAVTCSTYAQRPSPCREVEVGDEKCNKARARHGLTPLAADETRAASPMPEQVEADRI